ncbi:MAG: zf-HC2 domain-containing protein [Verrucomicrobia bacterium]|nr:zf-HC2 domain-containing protein [Verrucomicrobiota bacterium]
MVDTFKILTAFLDKFAVEAEGNTPVEPTEEIKRKLGAFAKGELPEAEREELIALLKANPHWVSFLADQAKMLRSSDETDANGTGAST